MEVGLTSTEELDAVAAEDISELSVAEPVWVDGALPEPMDDNSADSAELAVPTSIGELDAVSADEISELSVAAAVWVAARPPESVGHDSVEVATPPELSSELEELCVGDALDASLLWVTLGYNALVESLLCDASEVEVIWEDSVEAVVAVDSEVAGPESVPEDMLVADSVDSLAAVVETGVSVELLELLSSLETLLEVERLSVAVAEVAEV